MLHWSRNMHIIACLNHSKHFATSNALYTTHPSPLVTCLWWYLLGYFIGGNLHTAHSLHRSWSRLLGNALQILHVGLQVLNGVNSWLVLYSMFCHTPFLYQRQNLPQETHCFFHQCWFLASKINWSVSLSKATLQASLRSQCLEIMGALFERGKILPRATCAYGLRLVQ